MRKIIKCQGTPPDATMTKKTKRHVQLICTTNKTNSLVTWSCAKRNPLNYHPQIKMTKFVILMKFDDEVCNKRSLEKHQKCSRNLP